MNFSKKETADRQKKIKSPSRKLAVKAGVSFFRTFLVCIVMVVIIGAIAGYGAVRGIIDNAPSIDPIQVVPTGYSTTVYDSKGNQIQKLIGSGGNRIYKTIDQIPTVVQNAFIAIEDERFWTHNGIDVKGIFRAFFTGLSNGSFNQGASTITQQLLKNQIFEGGMESSFSQKLERKFQEQYLAIQLEDKLTKEQILEYYLNSINLGQNTLGVQTASLRYFNKDVSELTLSEATVIAGITQSPSNLNPITSPDDNAKRRIEILNNMKTQGYITEVQYTEALADNVYDRIQMVNDEQSASGSSVNSYFVDELINQVTEDLQTRLGYNSTQAINMIYRGGLSIYTTQNTSLQNSCDKILKDESLYPAGSEYELIYRLTVVDSKGEKKNYNEIMLEAYFKKQSPYFTRYFKKKKDAKKYIEEYRKSILKKGDTIEGERISYPIQPQVSFVLMDQTNGKVLAIVGGRGAKVENRTLNRASDSVRQPGSTFKILSTYLPALDTKGMTLASVQDDAPFYYPNSTKQVSNWNKNVYKGLTTLRQAIYDSMNVATVKTLVDVTPQTGFAYLERLGFTTLEQRYVDENGIHTDISYPMALGGLTKGVTNLELTAAFAAIANGGNYNKPVFYTKILDHEGKVILDNTPKSSQVMKDSTAWLLTSAMQDVVSIGTGTRVRFQNVNMPIAGKTGTTTDDKDLWFVGYTPYYTAGLWGGYDNNKPQTDTGFVKVLWRTIMEKLHAKKERKDFIKPESITSGKICTKCGKLAVSGLCDKASGGPCIRTEYFAKGTVPTENCNCHVKVKVCKASDMLPSDFCPEADIKEKVYLMKNETANTADTPNILPKNFESRPCKVHTHEEVIPEETPKPEKTPDNGLPPVADPTPQPIVPTIVPSAIPTEAPAVTAEPVF